MAVKIAYFVPLLVLGVVSGCESDLNHSLVHNDKPGGGNEMRVPPSDLVARGNLPGSSLGKLNAQGGQAANSGVLTPGAAQTSVYPPKAGADLAGLTPGSPCRIDLVRPAGQGQAYQGTVVRVDDKAIVLSNVISEGPCKRSRAPSVNDLTEMRMPWSPAPTAIDWQRLPDKEVRIARSEVSSVKILDHDPIADYYAR